MTTPIDILNVTQEQLDRCRRLWDDNKQEWFYMVESERDSTVEYEVRFTRGKGFTCTCPAGQSGFHYCRSTCKHCRWATAHAHALREECREQGQIESLVRQGVDRETAQRLVYANDHPFHYTDLQVKIAQYDNQREAFSLL